MLSHGREGRAGLEEFFHLYPGHAAFRVLQAAPKWRACWAQRTGHTGEALPDPLDVHEFQAVGRACGYDTLARWLTGLIHFPREISPRRQEQLAERFDVPWTLRPRYQDYRQGTSREVDVPGERGGEESPWHQLYRVEWEKQNAEADRKRRGKEPEIPKSWWGPSQAYVKSGGRVKEHDPARAADWIPGDMGSPAMSKSVGQFKHDNDSGWNSENSDGRGPAHKGQEPGHDERRRAQEGQRPAPVGTGPVFTKAGLARHDSDSDWDSENSEGRGPAHHLSPYRQRLAGPQA